FAQDDNGYSVDRQVASQTRDDKDNAMPRQGSSSDVPIRHCEPPFQRTREYRNQAKGRGNLPLLGNKTSEKILRFAQDDNGYSVDRQVASQTRDDKDNAMPQQGSSSDVPIRHC